MSGDVQSNRKKSKKDKKRTRFAEESAPVIEDAPAMHPKPDAAKRGETEDASPLAESEVPSTVSKDELAHSKKRKKDKKKKDKTTREVTTNPPENNDFMNVDATESSTPTESEEVRGEKTKKKRKRGDLSLVDADELDSRKEKRKKRKSLDGGQTEESNGVITDAGKKEKEIKKIPSTSDEAGTHSSITPSLPSTEAVTTYLTKHSITVNVPEGHSSCIPVLSFSQLSLPDGISKALEGFSEPTPIQACAWPYAIEGQDVVGIAETGSGKTLAFGIPALSRLIKTEKHRTDGVSILVVAPTRELAVQTHETLSDLGKPFDVTSVAVFGGVPKEGQIALLKKAGVAGGRAKKGGGPITKIVVGTPGRILDLASEGVCDLSGVDYLVLDEADRMLDKGFENDIRRIIEQTRPKEERQTMMFSATWPEAVRRLASTFQRDPVRVTVGSDDLTANSRIEQTVEVFDDARSKDSRLINLLKSLGHKRSGPNNRILIFALYKKEASRVELMLKRQGYTVGALHGDMSQTARMDALENFKNGVTGLLVATDVAARGLDIPNVEVVINYTFPLTIEDYIHRIGRTGRGGKSGKSITYFTGDSHERGLAGELARVLREGGFDYDALKKFPMTIKKKEHSAYGAFFRDDIPVPKGPTKIVF